MQCNINAPKMSITDILLLTKSNICSIMILGGRTKEGVGEVKEKIERLGDVQFFTNEEFRKMLNEIFQNVNENYKLRWFYELAVEKLKG